MDATASLVTGLCCLDDILDGAHIGSRPEHGLGYWVVKVVAAILSTLLQPALL